MATINKVRFKTNKPITMPVQVKTWGYHEGVEMTHEEVFKLLAGGAENIVMIGEDGTETPITWDNLDSLFLNEDGDEGTASSIPEGPANDYENPDEGIATIPEFGEPDIPVNIPVFPDDVPNSEPSEPDIPVNIPVFPDDDVAHESPEEETPAEDQPELPVDNDTVNPSDPEADSAEEEDLNDDATEGAEENVDNEDEPPVDGNEVYHPIK